jgi:hypothetical protein
VGIHGDGRVSSFVIINWSDSLTHKAGGEDVVVQRTVLVVSIAVALAAPANADLITYTEVASVASGTFAGKVFTNGVIRIVGTGDTANVTEPSPGVFQNTLAAVTVTVDTIGTGTFLNVVTVSDIQQGGNVGFSDSTAPILFTTLNPALATYDLRSSIAVSGAPGFIPGRLFMTSLGGFTINSIPFPTGFVAIVPEPSPLLLASIGIAMMLAARAFQSALAARRATRVFIAS